MNKKAKILLALGALLLLVLAAAYLKEQDRDKAGVQNSIASIESAVEDKTFQSKISAWEAYANEKEEYYKRSSHSFMTTGSTTVNKKEEPVLSESLQPVEMPTPQNIISNSTADEQFDAAYEEVARNIEHIYENSPEINSIALPHAQVSAHDISVESDAYERRREAMMRDWGMTEPSRTTSSSSEGMFRAVIHGTQTIKSGQTALFRTKEEIRYGSVVVPVNTLLTGWASISDNRLTIKINSVRLGHEVYALPLDVYGSDGMQGLPLNYDAAGKLASTQASSTATQEISSAASRYGGTIGRVAGTIISGVGSQVQSIKKVEVKLIDNQSVTLKIAEQK